jgi:hypothetical protein
LTPRIPACAQTRFRNVSQKGKTPLLNFSHLSLTELVKKREWAQLPEYERIGRIYAFVQNEIAFGYNDADDIPASEVLKDGYEQCNTKGTLLMALLQSRSRNLR